MKKLITFIAAFFIAASAFAQNVRVTFYSPEIVRVEKMTDSFRSTPSVSVTMSPEAVKLSTTRRGSVITYTSQALKVTVDESTGNVSFADARGRRLTSEAGNSCQKIEEGLDRGLWSVGQSWTLEKDEPVYGVGMLQNGKMSQRGEDRILMQSNTEDYANFFQSVKGYGIFWDNYSPTRMSDDGTVLTLTSQVAEAEDYYFIYGGNADGVIASMRKLTGTVPMIPLWTYGFHQSRERYKSQKELLDVVRGYRAAGVPLDGIIQDWQYWGNNYLWNAMEFLNEEFPDPKAMVDEVHSMGAHMTISIWQSFGVATKQFRELSEKGLMLGFKTWPPSGLTPWPPRMDYPSGVRCYDAYSAEARDIYWQHLRRLHDLDIDAWWMDSTDPDCDNNDIDLDTKTVAGSFRSVRNSFPLMCVEGVYDHQRATSDSKRVFILTRSYFAGQQRTGANTWSGDVGSDWNTFRKQIPLCLNYTMTASPQVNTDIGGFFPGGYNKPGQPATCSQNPLFRELYVRWLQFGLFNPMMRSHGETSRREIWEFGKKGEPVYDAIEKTIKMRYSLLPYIYGTAWQVTSANDSFMRPLVMDFASDKNVLDMGEEFMFGRSLLVAPVTHALYTNDEKPHWAEPDTAPDWTESKTVEVYLPAGADWYEWTSGKLFKGGRTVVADASIASVPLYARAGSIVPLGPDVQYAQQKSWDELELRVFPGANGSFTLYEDEGDSYNYEKGMYSTIEFRLNGNTLAIGKRQGSYPGMLTSRIFRVVTPDGRSGVVEYSGEPVKVNLSSLR